jgi:hypothetical protein
MDKLNIQIIACGRLHHQVTSQFVPLDKPHQVFVLKFVLNFYLHRFKTSKAHSITNSNPTELFISGIKASPKPNSLLMTAMVQPNKLECAYVSLLQCKSPAQHCWLTNYLQRQTNYTMSPPLPSHVNSPLIYSDYSKHHHRDGQTDTVRIIHTYTLITTRLITHDVTVGSTDMWTNRCNMLQ